METPTPSPPQISSGQPKIIKFMTQSAENFVTPTNIKSPQKSRTITLSALELPNKGRQKSILLNNIAIQYIPDTGAAISVISEEVARILNVEIKPYDKSRIKAVTADGKEVKDILGFADVDVTLGNQTLEKVKMLVFKNSTNPCLIGGGAGGGVARKPIRIEVNLISIKVR